MTIPNKATIEARKVKYQRGRRVELVIMNDPYSKLAPGEKGTVEFVDDIGTIHIRWDGGSMLGAACGEDVVKLLPSPITDTLKEQILAVRATAKTNMFDYNAVQIIANDMGFFELVVFLETERKAYSHFILTGERGNGDA